MNSQSRMPMLLETIDKRAPDIRRLLPKQINVDRFVNAVKTAILTVKDLDTCTPSSVTLACLKCASDGLVPDGREAVLVVGRSKSKTGGWVNQAQYWTMVAGLQKMAYRSGKIARLESRVVHAGDDFSVEYGTSPGIRHRPALIGGGDLVGAYAVATFRDGRTYVEWMDRSEIEGIMRRSKSFDREKNAPVGPWQTDFAEMARKTVLRRACKYLPTNEDDAEETETDTELTPVDFQAIAGSLAEPLELEGQEVAEAEMLELDRPQAAPAPRGSSGVPTSRNTDQNGLQPPEEYWGGQLALLQDQLERCDSKEAVEEAWESWDASFVEVPAEITTRAKGLVDQMLEQIAAETYAKAKG